MGVPPVILDASPTTPRCTGGDAHVTMRHNRTGWERQDERLSDAQIQLIPGHESKKSLEVYQHLSLESVDKAYQDAVQTVGI
jgi:hypothetical protein